MEPTPYSHLSPGTFLPQLRFWGSHVTTPHVRKQALISDKPAPGSPADEVLSLPGWDAPLPSRHFSGLVPVSGGSRELHYYVQEAETAPTDKPLMLWLNGGPGTSALFGAFTELGQLLFNRNSMEGKGAAPKLFRNPYAWTREVNLLFLESPAGVGFSRCRSGLLGANTSTSSRRKGRCVSNDTSTAQQNADALEGFLRVHAEYVGRDLYLAGESYAGIYLPMLVAELDRRGWQSVGMTLRGVAIGNGCWGTTEGTNCADVTGKPAEVYRIDAEYFAGRGLISARQKRAADAACGGAWRDPLSLKCLVAYANISRSLGPFNIDNVDDTCISADVGALVDGTEDPPAAFARTASLLEHRERGRHFLLRPRQNELSRTTSMTRTALATASSVVPPPPARAGGELQMWCGAEKAMDRWLALPEVMEALHVNELPRPPSPPLSPGTAPGTQPPLVFDGPVHGAPFKYVVEPLDLRPLYRMLAARPRTALLIFNGLADGNVPFNGQVDYWANEEDITIDWAPWFVGEGLGAAARQVDGAPSATDDAPRDGARRHGEPIAGHVRTYRRVDSANGTSGPFRFVTVEGAGHEVPTYRPEAALSMLRQFLLS